MTKWFGPLRENEKDFFSCLKNDFFTKVDKSNCFDLGPAEWSASINGVDFFNIFDKIVCIDRDCNVTYANKHDAVSIRELVEAEKRIIEYAVKHKCDYGLYKDGVFSFCGANIHYKIPN